MNELIDALSKIGLAEKEARVYLALLKIGDATVKDIAAEAVIKRPTTYLALEELRLKGLILKIPHAKKAIYRAKLPEDLYGFAEENMNSLKRVLPKIDALATERNPVKTYYFEGLQGLKDSLFYEIDRMENKTLGGFWAKVDKAPKSVTDLFLKFHSALKKRNVAVNGITPDDETIQKYKDNYPAKLYSIKTVSKSDYSSDISVEITDSYVRIIDPIEMKAVIIENKRVADTMKQILDLVKK